MGILDAPVTGITPKGAAPGATIVWIGDSFTFVGGNADYDDNQDRPGKCLTMWAEVLCRGRLKPLANLGAGSTQPSDWIVDQVPDAIALRPTFVGITTSGINALKSSLVTLEELQADMVTVLDMLLGAGIIVLTSTVGPATDINTTQEIEDLFVYNRWLVDLGKTRKGLYVADIYPLLAAPASVLYQTGWDDAADGLHPGIRGSHAIGRAYADILNTLLAGEGNRLPTSNADPWELLTNPMMTGTGGTLGAGTTGAVASSTTIANAGGATTASKVARTDGIPSDWQRVVGTGSTAISQTVSTGFSVGDRVVARVELRCDFTVALPATLEVVLEFNDAGAAMISDVQVDLSAAADAPLLTTDQLMVVECNTGVIPALCTSMRLVVRVTAQAGATVDVGRMSIYPED